MGLESGSGGGGRVRSKGKKTPNKRAIDEALLAAAVLGIGYEESPDAPRTLAEPKVTGGYEGFLLQGGNTLSPNRTAPETITDQEIAPKITLRGRNPQRPAPEDASSSALDMLQQFITQGAATSSSFDYESVLRDSEDAIRDAYAADIAAIRTNNKQARRDTRRDRAEVEDMYGALSKALMNDSKNSVNQANRFANQDVTRAGNVADRMEKRYDRSAGNVAELLQGLGVGEAAPDLSIYNQGLEDLNKNTQETIQRGENEAEQEQRLGTRQSNLFRNRARSAQFEGTDRSLDMLSDLRNYVQDNRAQIGQLRGARAKELAANEAGVMETFATMEQERNDDMYNRLMDYAKLQASVEDDIADNARADAALSLQAQNQGGSGSNFELPDYMSDPANLLAERFGGKPKVAEDLMGLFSNDFLTQPGFTENYAERMNPYQAAELMRKVAAQAGIRDVKQLQALIDMAKLSVGY